MTRKSGQGVPALQNDDVTGMTEESGRAPRHKAAEEFYEEQQEQAAETEPGEKHRK